MKSKPRNPLAKMVRSEIFRQRVVADKRRKEGRKAAKREMRECFSKRSTAF